MSAPLGIPDMEGFGSIYDQDFAPPAPGPGEPGSFAIPDMSGFTSAYDSPQGRAQAIARHMGFSPSASFGDTIPERLLADFGKGIATSLPGRFAGTMLGSQENLLELRNIPAAQPIPYFPDFDTLGVAAAEAPLFALVPFAAAPGRLAGRGLARLAGVNNIAAKRVATALARPSAEHIALARGMAEELSGKLASGLTRAAEAIGGAATAGGAFAGAEAFSGGDTADQFIQGILAGAAAFAKPAFQASRAIGSVNKLTSEKFLEAEKGLADLLDSNLGKMVVMGGLDETAGRKAVYEAAEALSPGFGRDIEGVIDTLGIGRRGTGSKIKTFGESIPELRGLVSTWEDLVSANKLGAMEKASRSSSVADAAGSVARGLFSSVDASLRKLGPAGGRLAGKIRNQLDESRAMFTRIASQFDDVIRKATDDEWKAFADAVETGRPVPQKFAAVAKWMDDDAVTMLGDAGVNIQRPAGIPRGQGSGFFPHLWDVDELRQWIRNPANAEKLARKLGQDPKHFRTTLNEMDRDIAESFKSPAKLLQTNLDFARKWNLSLADARELGMPIGTPREIFVRYLKQVSDRVISSKHWGADSKGFEEMVGQVLQKADIGPMMSKLVADSARRSAGLDYTPAGDLTRAIRWFTGNVTVPSKLAMAVISNASQSMNTVAQVGSKHYANGVNLLRKEWKLAKRLSPDAPEMETFRRIRTAVDDLAGDLMGDLVSGGDKGALMLPEVAGRSKASRLNLGGWILNKTGFSSVEKFNRLAAAYSGRSYLESTVKDVMSGAIKPGSKSFARASRDFGRLGLDLKTIAARGGLTVDEAFDGAMKISNQTQFNVRPFDLPHYWSSTNAAAFRMLKTFAFNQSRFIFGKNGIVRRSVRDFARSRDPRDLRPLAALAAGFPMSGMAVGSIRNGIKGRGFDPSGDEKDGPMADLMAAYSWVGGLGFLQDLVKNIDDGERSMGAFAMGPVLADAFSMSNALIDSAKDGSTAPLARRLLRMVPLLSQDIGGVRSALEDEWGLQRRKR